MSNWSLVYEGFDPEEEGLREALCTLGNGYFATRGAAPEAAAGDVHYPGTYLAGGYNRLRTEIAGRTVENEDLVNLPNWLPLTFRIGGGDWFDLKAVEILSYRQELDLRRGLLLRTIRFRDSEDRRTKLVSRRLVHMRYSHLAALETTFTAENWSGRVAVRSALDGCVVNAGVKRYRQLSNQHLQSLEAYEITPESLFLKVQTSQSEIRIAQAARTQLFRKGERLSGERRAIEQPCYVGHEFAFDLEQGSEVSVEKIAALSTSRDHVISECGEKAREAVANAGRFSQLLESHARAWANLWRRFDIEIERAEPPDGDRMAMIVHLYLFHLVQTVSVHTIDLDVGVPARGWHGEAYRGHIFWDELFVFPLLNFRIPEISRALLKYRFRRLDQARESARRAGYRGAMYPWQSGSTGREETQQLHLNPKSGRWNPDHTHLQHHVSSAIAYNVWSYYQATRDMEFLCYTGAEMILEIARFWSDIATYNPSLERYEILGVIGPDEYHDAYPDAEKPGLDNNAYTNVMAVWVLRTALELLDLLPEDRREELCGRLEVDHQEIERWDDISRRMRLVFHGDGIISQFERYDELEEFDWEGYREKYGNIQRLDRILEAENDTPNRYKASKQADVLMLFYLFSSEELSLLLERMGYAFDPDTIPKNVEYYLHRTSHGSTLSRVVHSWVLARSDREHSWQLFTEALESDVADTQGGTTPEGIHLGAMAGAVDLLERVSTGIDARGDVLWFNPCLPEQLARLRMHLRYRGHSLRVDVTADKLKISSTPSKEKPIEIGVRDKVFVLREGETRELALPGHEGCP